MDDYGTIHLRIDEILEKKEISKTTVCKAMDIPRTNFNKYCRDEFQRLDAGLLCKLCFYLEVDMGELIEYKRPEA